MVLLCRRCLFAIATVAYFSHFATVSAADEESPVPIQAEHVSVMKIWDRAPHNAFTDLIRWRDRWYCAFREGQGHAGDRGKLRVITSTNGENWQSATALEHERLDLRDANLSVTPDDQLMALGGAQITEKKTRKTGTFASFSSDGETWTPPELVVPLGRWLWGVTWHQGTAWGVSYPTPDRPGVSSLLSSTDGREFETTIADFLNDGERPTEARIRFSSDGTAYCLHRRDGRGNKAYLGSASSPYKEWTWNELDRYLGGPNFLQLPSGEWVAAGRINTDSGSKTMVLYLDVEQNRLVPLLTLPSGGDTSYPGLVWHDGLLWVSYYSSHEDRTSIYLEKVRIEPTKPVAAADSKPKAIGNRGYSIPIVDLARDTDRQIIVDREREQYLGHPTTVLLEDDRTLLTVYPKGHGRGAIVMKKSSDAGQTWSDRLPTPATWATSREVPTIHRVVDAAGQKRLIMWSGLYPARIAVSEDDGEQWSELKPAGDWGGIVVMGFVEPLKSPGHYLAMFHDDGRFFTATGKRADPVKFTLYKTLSKDGGLTWSTPEAVQSSSDIHLCEPGCIRSPDGAQLAVLLRENARRKNSYIIFSDDEGQSWTEPRELPGALTGDRHVGKYTPDGRLFISFRDTTHKSPTKGDWVGWVGKYDDLVAGAEGQYRVRLMDNHRGNDCAYPGVEVFRDGTILTTTYGHWTPNESPYIVALRFKLEELDELVAAGR